jgi:hypothetical protein
MSELVTNCPRCGANEITFDVLSANSIGIESGWQSWYETFCVCRRCKKATIFVLCLTDIDYKNEIDSMILKNGFALNEIMEMRGYINLKDINKNKPPEHIPALIEEILIEGITCMTVGCNNAAGTMFRLCVDLCTAEMLPKEDITGLNSKIRRDLGLRLPWLFNNKRLPESLMELSSCIKEDGNDGAHRGILKKEDTEDMFDFTFALLERIYTEPKKLELAKERRENRRSKSNN